MSLVDYLPTVLILVYTVAHAIKEVLVVFGKPRWALNRYLFTVPTWCLFAPDPPSTDYHLFGRTEPLGEWVAIGELQTRCWYHGLWHPEQMLYRELVMIAFDLQRNQLTISMIEDFVQQRAPQSGFGEVLLLASSRSAGTTVIGIWQISKEQ